MQSAEEILYVYECDWERVLMQNRVSEQRYLPNGPLFARDVVKMGKMLIQWQAKLVQIVR